MIGVAALPDWAICGREAAHAVAAAVAFAAPKVPAAALSCRYWLGRGHALLVASSGQAWIGGSLDVALVDHDRGMTRAVAGRGGVAIGRCVERVELACRDVVGD